MGKVVAGLALSHAPGALGFPEDADPAVRKITEDATIQCGQTLTKEDPDVIFAILDDHFENFYRDLTPSLAIGVAERHEGPATQNLKSLRMTEKIEFDGAPQLAELVLASLHDQGFDVARVGPTEFGNNLIVPWVLMKHEAKCPVIPVFINVFTPPLIKYGRAYDFGQALRKAVETSLPADTKVAFLATGGLSHWPPVWNPNSAEDDEFLQRMKKFQTEGPSVLKDDPDLKFDLNKYEMHMAATNDFPRTSKHPLVNEAWDRDFLKHFVAGDVEYMKNLTYDEVEKQAGHGGHEVLNWVCLMGAMDGQPSTLHAYEAVIEWICGMAYVDFAKR
jgi:2,3-dihydroxyphenylpropionate 1,2-dioxygenase